MNPIICPNCGFENPETRQSCPQCGFILNSDLAESTAVKMVDCPICQGMGVVYLQYEAGFVPDPESQWLPCAACDGTGKRAAFELRDEEFKRGCREFIINILDGLGKCHWI